MSLLGIDVGTTGCKAAAFSLDGAIITEAHREYPTLHPQDGWAELDSTLVLDSAKAVIADVAARTAADPITALSISSLGEAMTPIDRNGRVLADTRDATGWQPSFNYFEYNSTISCS